MAVDITGIKPITVATVSTNIQIQVGGITIGYIRSLTEGQSQPATLLYEVGTVGIVEQVSQQPGAVILNVTKVATYHKNLINSIARVLKIQSESDIQDWDIPRGMTAGDVKTALGIWYGKMSKVTTPQAVYALQYLPLGFTLKATETNPMEQDQVTTYHGCKITRYSRPIVASGELVVAETADISCRYVDYQ